MRVLIAATAALVVGCGAASEPAGDAGAAFDPSIVETPLGADGGLVHGCRIGANPAAAVACGDVPWVWTQLNTFQPCSATCTVGAACHILSGYPGVVNNNGACVTAEQGAMYCDSSLPWTWGDAQPCNTAPAGVQCTQLVNGVCQ